MLEKHLSDVRKNAAKQFLSKNAKQSIEEITYRLPDLQRSGLDLDRYRKNGPHVSVEYPNDPEPKPGVGPFARYPEFDIWKDKLIPAQVWVRELPWKPFEPPVRLKPERTIPLMQLPKTGFLGQGRNRYAEKGTAVHLDRAYDALVAIRSGRTADERIYRTNKAAPTAGWTVSFVVDLTISMLALPAGQNGDSPIVKARQAIHALAPWLENSGVPTAIFGVQDRGPKNFNLFVAKEFGVDYHPHQVASLHPVAFGGFRIGAIVRHLSERQRSKIPGVKNLVVLLTDSGSHYVAPGASKIVQSNGCKSCRMRSSCPMEPIDQSLSIRVKYDYPKIYYPTFYAMEDIRKAKAEVKNQKHIFVSLTEGLSRSVLEEAFGKNVVKVEEFSDLKKMIEKVVRNHPETRNC